MTTRRRLVESWAWGSFGSPNSPRVDVRVDALGDAIEDCYEQSSRAATSASCSSLMCERSKTSDGET